MNRLFAQFPETLSVCVVPELSVQMEGVLEMEQYLLVVFAIQDNNGHARLAGVAFVTSESGNAMSALLQHFLSLF